MLMKGAIAFAIKKGLWAQLLRSITRREWDCAFVITSISDNDIVVAEVSPKGIRRTKIVKYESSSYKVTFFLPSGFSDAAIERAIGVTALPVMAMVFGPNAIQDLLSAYLRTLDPAGDWMFMMSGMVPLKAIFAKLAEHPNFRAITSS